MNVNVIVINEIPLDRISLWSRARYKYDLHIRVNAECAVLAEQGDSRGQYLLVYLM